jgi:hypothetical protein
MSGDHLFPFLLSVTSFGFLAAALKRNRKIGGVVVVILKVSNNNANPRKLAKTGWRYGQTNSSAKIYRCDFHHRNKTWP